jgi:uncharacterized protein YyaL (SSP411 family)
MMLSAFADAAAALVREDYRETAVRNAEFILGSMRPEGRLCRTGKETSGAFQLSLIPAFLEDYACFVDGLLHLYSATFDLRWIEAARELADEMIERFQAEDGGFYDTPSDGEELIDRPRDHTDNATPAGSSVAVDVLLRLQVLTGEDRYREIAAAILRKLAPLAAKHPQAFGRLLCAADFYVGPVKELAVIGSMEDEPTKALLTVARAGYRPNLILMCAPEAVTGYPLLEGRKTGSEGIAAAYVCENFACRAPTSGPDELKKLLD